jgi:hypothetical protein
MGSRVIDEPGADGLLEGRSHLVPRALGAVSDEHVTTGFDAGLELDPTVIRNPNAVQRRTGNLALLAGRRRGLARRQCPK